MENALRRSVAFLSVAVLSLSLAAVAYASSYSTSYNFSVYVKGSTRSFNGSNILFDSPNADSYPSPHALNHTYTVSLYRDNPFFDDYIGTDTLYRDTHDTAYWSSVGSGNYYVTLNKANDGITLIDNNVTIANY